ncbi:MAG: cystathionine beta-synthase [Actinobacteria bacterium]|nr:cystathionine beta-synthase [Actinomycetota bacterium]MDQ3531493.1 cystathionine beta-synthase [Actinomycetota bacterium]
MDIRDTILDAVGQTPLLRLRRMTSGLSCAVIAKLEMLNPGGSIKDRIALTMIEAAEKTGDLKPGGTIVEPTSGNTGAGLAIAAAIRGYRCIFTMPDKMSQEKISLLRAYGAEVVIAPTAVPPESPESYYRVADRLAEEIPGAFQPNQYFNQANPQAHYDTTGPEIWSQTEGTITHLVAGVGTGGTITGTGRYLKERKPGLVVVGADPEGSVFSGTQARPYLVEGVGEDFWPGTFDPSVVDRWVTVSDRNSFVTARRAAREEGLLVGGSCGTALWASLEVARELGRDDVLVVILPDTGRSYLSKIYNDSWMLEHGFTERPGTSARIGEVLIDKARIEPAIPALVAVPAHERVGNAIDRLQSYGISQIPVAKGESPQDLAEIVGSINERSLLDRVFRDREAIHREVVEVMDPPLPVVQASSGVDEMFADLSRGAEAVVVVDGSRPSGVLTRADLLEFLAHQNG